MVTGKSGEIIQRFVVNWTQFRLLRETSSISGLDNLWWCKYYLVQRTLKSQGFDMVWSFDLVLLSPANAERLWSKYLTVCNINSTLVTHAILQILGQPHICFKWQMSTEPCFFVCVCVWTGSHWQRLAGEQEEEKKMKENRGRVPEGHAPSQYSKLTEVDKALPLCGSLSRHCWNIELLGPHGCNRQVRRWKQLSVCHCWACESQEYWAFSETKSRAGKCYRKGHCSLLFSPELGQLRPDNGFLFQSFKHLIIREATDHIAVTHFLPLFKTPHHTLCFPFFVEIVKASLTLNLI